MRTHTLSLHTTSPENRATHTRVSLKKANEDKIWKDKEMSKKWLLNFEE